MYLSCLILSPSIIFFLIDPTTTPLCPPPPLPLKISEGKLWQKHYFFILSP